jgi:hypothetical protein
MERILHGTAVLSVLYRYLLSHIDMSPITMTIIHLDLHSLPLGLHDTSNNLPNPCLETVMIKNALFIEERRIWTRL